MVPFEVVLGQVRRALREASSSDRQSLLSRLMEARFLSWDYYLSLTREGDMEDVARRISLAVWQNWESCRGSVCSLLEKVPDCWDLGNSLIRSPVMQEAELLSLLEEGLPFDFGLDFDPFSPNPNPLEDGNFCEGIDDLIQSLTEDDLGDLNEVSWVPSLPEKASSEKAVQLEKAGTVTRRKRDYKAATLTLGDPNTKCRKTGHLDSGVNPKAGKAKRRALQNRERLLAKAGSEQKRKSGTAIASATSSPKTTLIGCATPFVSAPRGVLPRSSNAFPQFLQLPISNLSALGNAAFFNSCGNGPALHVIQAITLPQQMINISVPKTLGSGRPTYVLVPPPPLTPTPPVMPLSPAIGTVVPTDLLVSSPVSSSSDSPLQDVSPVSGSSPSLTGEIPSCKGLKSPDLELALTTQKPKCVEDYIQLVKSHMRDTCQSMAMEKSVLLESLYIDVPLIQRQIQVKSGKNASKCLEKELVILCDADRRRATVIGSQLFEDAGQKPKTLIALLGKTGVGKSTYIQKLCLDWSNDELPRFEYVFMLESKTLNLPQTNYSLKSLLFDLPAGSSCKNTDGVFKHILSVPQKVLIIFDGFDDFRDYDGLLHSPATCDTKDNFSIKQLVSGLFQKKLLAGCTLLIAARPKEVLNQFLGKVDKIVELCGFSPEQTELYVSRYFEGTSYCEQALNKLKNNRYMFSLCSNPLICRYICFLLERSDDNRSLPSTLTGLYEKVLYHRLNTNVQVEDSVKEQQKRHVSGLSCAAWARVKNHNSPLTDKELNSAELKEFGINCGLLTPYAVREKGGEEKTGHGFDHLITQSFLGALHMAFSRDVSYKALVSHMMAPQKRKRSPAQWLDLTQRFVLGLLFQKKCLFKGLLPEGGAADMSAKRSAAASHLKSLKPQDLSPDRLLELCHCAYETGDAVVIRNLVKNLPGDLSFSGAQLCPPDICVLQHLLLKSKGVKKFSINFQETGIDLHGLKELLGLKCVLSFRASITDAISLWKDLQQSNDEELLKSSVTKFTIDPFKATQLCHVDNLAILVQIYRDRKLPNSDLNCSEPADEKYILNIPTVKNLHKLELGLGPLHGPGGFSKLLVFLPALRWLQHLDLEDNKIGDAGADQLAEVVPALSLLERLNLSQNCIGDNGIAKLAPTLCLLTSLHSLSLYSNNIADSGAESLATALPQMRSLTDLDVKYNKFTDIGAQKLSSALGNSPWVKTVRMWNHYVPHGVLEHLKQQDSRIRSL